jgi:hypothetical protein
MPTTRTSSKPQIHDLRYWHSILPDSPHFTTYLETLEILKDAPQWYQHEIDTLESQIDEAAFRIIAQRLPTRYASKEIQSVFHDRAA